MISGKEQLEIINRYKDEIKSSNTVQELFKNKGVKLEFIDYIPVRFGDIEVSARTEKGIIILNFNLLDKIETIKHYLVHEITHWLQQCFSDGPTQGSSEGDYLDNEFEVEGFQYQADYLEEEDGERAADRYIEKVLDHHDVRGKEREDKKRELLAFFKPMFSLISLANKE